MNVWEAVAAVAAAFTAVINIGAAAISANIKTRTDKATRDTLSEAGERLLTLQGTVTVLTSNLDRHSERVFDAYTDLVNRIVPGDARQP